jgi:hypothetical protein
MGFNSGFKGLIKGTRTNKSWETEGNLYYKLLRYNKHVLFIYNLIIYRFLFT